MIKKFIQQIIYYNKSKSEKERTFSFDNYFRYNHVKKHIKLTGLVLEENNYFSAIIKPKFSRMTFQTPINEIKDDTHLINGFHPIETFILGIFLHIENNNLTQHYYFEREVSFHINEKFYPSINPLLKINKIYFIETEPFVLVNLFSLKTKKEQTIPVLSFMNNFSLIFSLSPSDAFSVGYQVADSFFRKKDEF